jgi:hypothetical protein
VTHPSHLLDDKVHQGVRQRIPTMLNEVDAVDFTFSATPST